MQHKKALRTGIAVQNRIADYIKPVIIAFLFLVSMGVNAQTKPISLTAKNTPIKEALREIEQKSGYRILYNDEVVPDGLRVSVNAENVAVKDLLNLMLQNTELTFVQQSDDLIVITRKEFTALANQITGLVVDETGEPVPFANVVQLALPDSAFINGASTGVNGRFSLERKSNNPVLLEITYLGYERLHAEVTDNSLGTIRLTPETTLLGEVVVTASRPTHKMEADGMVTSVQNTLLARLGTANDVLAQLPFVTGEDGSYTVFGRGAPLIYINNRLMRDNNELRQLNSADIKDVKVILTPGSQYDASVGSVIRITTVKPVGEGLSGTLYAYLRQRRNFDHYEYINLNYRKGGLDIFGTISFDKTNTLENQKNETINTEKGYRTEDNFKFLFDTKEWNVFTGLNYSFAPTHSVGIRYNYTKTPSDKFNLIGKTAHFANDINDVNFFSDDKRTRLSNNHYTNIYYHNEFASNTVIHFEADIVSGMLTENQISKYINEENDSIISVENHNLTNYSLYAGKLLLEKNLAGGKVTLGNEVSRTLNSQEYQMLNEDIAVDLPSNTNYSQQNLYAAFLSFDRTWQNISLYAGLRYENINFKYYLNDVLSKEQSKLYHNVFPTFSVSYKQKDVGMSFAYRTTVRRPNYYNLRSSIAYNNPYSYEGGNPALTPMYTHKLSYLFGWKDLQVEISYNWIKDYLLFIGEQFKDTEIVLFTMINLPKSQRLDASFSYSPKIGWWRPTFQAGLHKQNLQYKSRKYNNPFFTYGWNNIIQLPKDFMLTANIRGNLQGESDVSVIRPTLRTEVKLNKQLLDKKLNLTFAVSDVFGTDLQRWSMLTESMYFYKWNDKDSRSVYLQATYTFNATRSKYKGQGAANEERNRL